VHDADATALTEKEHDQIVNECFQCKLCYVNCPYTPDQDAEWKIDFPRLMLRSLSIMQNEKKTTRASRLLARTDLQGKVATKFSAIVNRSSNIKPARSIIQATTGIAKERLLPTFTKQRFSTWFRKHLRAHEDNSRGSVALFPTCLVEYQQPAVGHATVNVLEHNGVECSLPVGQVCCGMPWLDAGDDDKFLAQARKNVAALVPSVKEGKPVIVPQPTCAYVLKNDYPDYLDTNDARLVAENTYDISEYLMKQHRENPLDTDFTGQTFSTITWHQPCHYQAQQMGPQSMQLMRLTGAKVEMTNRCSAIDGTWGLRKENVAMAKKIAKPLMDFVNKKQSELVAGDCNLANTAIREGTGRVPVHPVEVIAAAYGYSDLASHVKTKEETDDTSSHT
jgi:Fe-S oxidoreductase